MADIVELCSAPRDSDMGKYAFGFCYGWLRGVDEFYDAIFFKLLLFDEKSNVVETGLSKIVDIAPDEYRHFEVSAPYKEKFHHCLGIIDTKFPKE